MNLGRSWTRSRGWAIDRGWCSTRATTRGSAPTRRRARFDFVFERSSSKPPRETLARRTHRHRHRVRVRSRASPSSPRRIIVERPRRDGARDTRVDEETTRSDAITHAHIFIIRIVHDTASNAALRSFVTTRGTERLRRRVSLPVDPSRGAPAWR